MFGVLALSSVIGIHLTDTHLRYVIANNNNEITVQEPIPIPHHLRSFFGLQLSQQSRKLQMQVKSDFYVENNKYYYQNKSLELTLTQQFSYLRTAYNTSLAVIAIPTTYNDRQRSALIACAKAAGLQPSLVNEPSALGLAVHSPTSTKIAVVVAHEGDASLGVLKSKGPLLLTQSASGFYYDANHSRNNLHYELKLAGAGAAPVYVCGSVNVSEDQIQVSQDHVARGAAMHGLQLLKQKQNTAEKSVSEVQRDLLAEKIEEQREKTVFGHMQDSREDNLVKNDATQPEQKNENEVFEAGLAIRDE